MTCAPYRHFIAEWRLPSAGEQVVYGVPNNPAGLLMSHIRAFLEVDQNDIGHLPICGVPRAANPDTCGNPDAAGKFFLPVRAIKNASDVTDTGGLVDCSFARTGIEKIIASLLRPSWAAHQGNQYCKFFHVLRLTQRTHLPQGIDA